MLQFILFKNVAESSKEKDAGFSCHIFSLTMSILLISRIIDNWNNVNMADQDYYNLLGVSRECTESELKKA